MRYYHSWFTTKHKKLILVDLIDQRIHELMKEIAVGKDIFLLASGSMPDHMHLLFGLEKDQPISWAIKTFKGISSRRIFQEFDLLKEHFRTNHVWARGYNAKEIPEKDLSIVVRYILNQKKDLAVLPFPTF
ncbi:MAG: IS200/IS605 family transposase [Candidatus Saganbacteria bacterium]|nr:IS200/IS605 family transposase [Candidatus Saganbacteria bacterium]